ncbi:ferredoxin [Streptomyces olindensis]|uniref:Ferredoxin n=1 Tax=Streptomyces olindensis TaxID=358823 RepID=A0ABV2Y9A9_9ACTN
MRDSSMQVGVDVNRCVASGMCALLAPGVFDQEERTGQVVLLAEHPPAAEWEAVEEAERSCPGQVIRFGEAAAARGEAG